MAAVEGRLPNVGQVLCTCNDRHFKLEERIGKGGYGCVYRVCATNSSSKFALKAELMTDSMLKIEISVLEAAKELKCRHICELVDFGVDTEFMFIVMTLLGPDLFKLKRQQPQQQFSLGTAVRIAIQTLEAIEELHTCGFVSRDVKPSNFAIGCYASNLHRRIFLIDFGLARRYVDKDWKILPSRGTIGWRGTCQYASLNAHRKQDLGRKDDVESWLYMAIEITVGKLPWKRVTDRELVLQAKEDLRSLPKSNFLLACPLPFRSILETVDQLEFISSPPYAKIRSSIAEARAESGKDLDDRLDWESDDTLSTRTPIPNLKSRPKLADGMPDGGWVGGIRPMDPRGMAALSTAAGTQNSPTSRRSSPQEVTRPEGTESTESCELVLFSAAIVSVRSTCATQASPMPHPSMLSEAALESSLSPSTRLRTLPSTDSRI